jgi:hypothetical protein
LQCRQGQGDVTLALGVFVSDAQAQFDRASQQAGGFEQAVTGGGALVFEDPQAVERVEDRLLLARVGAARLGDSQSANQGALVELLELSVDPGHAFDLAFHQRDQGIDRFGEHLEFAFVGSVVPQSSPMIDQPLDQHRELSHALPNIGGRVLVDMGGEAGHQRIGGGEGRRAFPEAE